MGGGKGGSQTSSVEVPQYIEDAARRNLAQANQIGQTGAVTYRGPDVAAFTPMQQAAFGNTNDLANAYGMGAAQADAGMGAPTQYANGVQGYSSAPIYDQALAAYEAASPAQADHINSFFIDPVTGELGSNAVGQIPTAADGNGFGSGKGGMGGANSQSNQGDNERDNMQPGMGGWQGPNQDGSAGGGFGGFGGYSGVGDMLDGGGAGASGDRFSGGGFASGIGNAFGGPRERR